MRKIGVLPRAKPPDEQGVAIMPVRPEFNPDYLYFVTTSAERHVKLFGSESAARILLGSLNFLRSNGRMNLFAFVVMPNHIHFIARSGNGRTLSDILRDFKRHTARQIIRQAQTQSNQEVLRLFEELNQDVRQQHKVWEDGYDAREIYSPAFLEQKMDYIHYNPCQPHWQLVAVPEDYPWSTAKFYLADQPAVIPVDDVREIFL
jgi:REP element-mobilizing transposase RayT